MRNVMACPDAGVSLDEPFDCAPDARWVSDGVLARSVELNCVLPSRVNFAFGGCPACAGHARLNDGGFESRIIDGEPGYRLWAGGSLGTMPRLGVLVADFMPRAHARAAAEALVDVFVAHGDLDDPKKGRLKYAVDRLGGDGLRAAFTEAMSRATGRDLGDPPLVGVPDPAAHAAVLARVPAGGWSTGVRPQRTPGVATVTVHVPLGDLDATDARAVAGLASLGDGTVYLTRNQNVAFRDVPLEALGGLRRALDGVGLSLRGAETATDVRACTGSAVCSLGITAAPSVAARLADIAGLARNAALRVHVSGCPNSCAQHQAADIGLSGAKVRLSGRTRLGYHLWLGGDLETGELGVVAGRVADDDAPSVVDAVIGLWEALRRPGERLADTVRRVGVDDFAAHVGALAGGFEAGDDAADERPKVPALI
jgi:sulfite reductase beta subunit-like hemoprotein